jgi:hypothetical protein
VSVVAKAVTGAAFYLGITWLNSALKEGGVSDVVQVTTPDGSSVSVTCGDAPDSVAFWNVYAGSSPDQLRLQNEAPLGRDDAWMPNESGLSTGKAPGNGQHPERWIKDRHVLPRG